MADYIGSFAKTRKHETPDLYPRGTVPLILKKYGIDPAVTSGRILTAITDMFGFFLTLTFASLMLTHLEGL